MQVFAALYEFKVINYLYTVELYNNKKKYLTEY